MIWRRMVWMLRHPFRNPDHPANVNQWSNRN